MENTEKLLFEGDLSEWFIAKGEDWLGPLNSQDIYRELSSGNIQWSTCIWKDGMGEWKPLVELEPFCGIFLKSQKKPKILPSSRLQKTRERESKQSLQSLAKGDKPTWFVRKEGVEYGPLREAEIFSMISKQALPASTVLWKEGFTTWQPLKSVFGEFLIQSANANEKRVHQRKPLVAGVYATNDQLLSQGVCRDISIGGMQVLTSELPGNPGDKIRLNVSLPELLSQEAPSILASGVIIRILEDRRGYSVRFFDLPPETRQQIESYLSEVTQ